MDATTVKIAAAGLCHDIGKFMVDDLLDLPSDFRERHAALYQPFYKPSGQYTHSHALLTAAFIESQKDHLPPEFNPPHHEPWGEGEPFINLAAGHHLPESSPWRWLIAEADRLSAGWERQPAGDTVLVASRHYRQTRLAPLLARLCPGNSHGQSMPQPQRELALPLAPVSPATIFPQPRDAGRGDDDQLYRDHCAGFLAALPHLAHRTENVVLWLEHFDSLLLHYTAAIPALRAGDVEPSRDVSLYDHARATAALAAALHLYHKETNTLTVEAIRSHQTAKFLFISGDFYGIQDYIFASGGETQRYRAKLLRGRSFTVSLLTELTADRLCRELGLPFLSIVLNAAGKFMIIAPHTQKARNTVAKVRREINQWLYEVSYGENAVGLTSRPVAAKDLLAGGFRDLWRAIGQDLEAAKLNRLEAPHFGPVGNYLEQFRNDLPRPLCPLCGKRPSRLSGPEDDYVQEVGSCCKTCRDHIFLGTNLVKRRRLAIVGLTADLHDPQNRLLKPLLGQYQVFFPEGWLSSLAQSGELYRFWDLSLPTPGEARPLAIARRFLNAYVPVVPPEDRDDDRLTGFPPEELEPGNPKTFGQLARQALTFTDKPGRYEGLEALGVLKADVDNLGVIMLEGLPPEKFTLARLATLSRQLHFFFCYYLPYLLQKEKDYRDIYTVFAGGDDLFLIGPWSNILSLARTLPLEFARYVGHNEVLHLSAGVILAKPHVPIQHLAAMAEEALEDAKTGEKNALALFGEVVSWPRVNELNEVRIRLEAWWQAGWLTSGLLYRLNDLIALAGEERRLLRMGSGIYVADLACCKWRSYLAYTVGRNVAPKLTGEARQRAVQEVHHNLAVWLDKYGSALKLPLWELLYAKRLRR
jgi:CRISPR-associated protein Csm1